MRAPAEIARLFTKATVRIREFNKASRISTAASTRPPKVLISRITAAAPASLASVKDALHERREPKVNDSLDGRDVNHRRLLREGKRVDAEDCQQSEANDP